VASYSALGGHGAGQGVNTLMSSIRSAADDGRLPSHTRTRSDGLPPPPPPAGDGSRPKYLGVLAPPGPLLPSLPLPSLFPRSP